MEYIVLIIITFTAVEIIWKPRIDTTEDGKILLWYGRRKREFFILFN
jgi:hypothetical protein